MKIYRTLTLPRILACVLFTVLFTGMVLFTSETTLTGEMIKSFSVLFMYIALIFFYASFGDSHYLYLAKATPGHKYFRSLPDAKKKFKDLCIKHDIIFFVLGILSLIPVAITDFTSTMYIIAFAGYMFTYAFFHITFVVTKTGMSTYMVLKAMSGGFLGMMIIFFGISIEESAVLGKMSMSVGIIVAASAIALAVIGLIVFYCNFEKKWNVE